MMKRHSPLRLLPFVALHTEQSTWVVKIMVVMMLMAEVVVLLTTMLMMMVMITLLCHLHVV